MAEAVVIDSPQSEPINPKVALLVIVAIVIVIVLLFYYFYKQGQSNIQPTFAALPNGLSTSSTDVPSGGTVPQSQLTAYAQAMHLDLPQYESWYTEIIPIDLTSNSGIWDTVNDANLNDTDMKGLYNTYNALYQSVNGGNTLINDIATGSQSTFASSALKNSGVAIMTRLQALTGQQVS